MPIGDVGVIGSATGRNFDDVLAAAAEYATSAHADALAAAASAAAANPAAFYASLPAAMRNALDGYFPSVVFDISRSQQMLNGAPVTSGLSSLLAIASGSKRVIGPTGTLDTVPANTLAFDWSSGRRRLLIEAASATNLCAYGRSPGLAGWVCRGVTPISGVDDPTGGADAVRVTLGAAVTLDVYQTVGIGAASARYEPSIFVRNQSGGILRIDGSAAPGIWAVDLALLCNGYERITRSHPAVTVIQEFVSGTGWLGGIDLYAQSGTVTVDLYVAQYDLGEVSTSPIITNGAVATRIADDDRPTTAHAAILTGASSSGVIRGRALWATGSGIVLAGATASVQYNPATGAATLTDGTHALTCVGTSGQDFGIAWSVSPSGRTLAVQSAPAAVTDTFGLFTSGEALRFGASPGGSGAVPGLMIDECGSYPFAGSAAAVKAQARVYA